MGSCRKASSRESSSDVHSVPVAVGPGLIFSRLEDRGNGLRIDGQHPVEIFHDEAAVFERHLYVALLEIFTVRVPQYRGKDFVPQLRFERLPINVEKVRVSGGAPVLQHVLPPRIRAVSDAHVIGHDIENQAHAVGLQLEHQVPELLLAADLGVKLVVVDDVVAVFTARTRLQQRRGITMADAESRQVRHQLARVLEAQAPVELQAIGGERARSALFGG